MSDVCSEVVAEARGPLQTATVAATAHRRPTAIVRPGVHVSAMEALSSRSIGPLRGFPKKTRRIRSFPGRRERELSVGG